MRFGTDAFGLEQLAGLGSTLSGELELLAPPEPDTQPAPAPPAAPLDLVNAALGVLLLLILLERE